MRPLKTTAFLLIILSLPIAATLFGQTAARVAEIPYAGDVPLTPNVRPVIIVSGSDFEMGQQWYEQIVQIYGLKPIEAMGHRKFSAEEVEALKTWQGYIQKHTPYMIDLMKGMAAGAKGAGVDLTFDEILAKWAAEDNLIPGARGSSSSGGGGAESAGDACADCAESDCSGWAAWGKATKDGKLYCGGSGDHQIVLRQNEIKRFEYCLLMMPKTGNNFVLSTSTGCCWHPGMNNKGVAMFHHGDTGYCGRYKKPEEQGYGYGVPNVMITMHTLRFANSAKEAQDIMLSLPSGDGRVGGSWADVNGNAFVLENRDNPRLIRKPGDNGETDFLYSTNNLFSKELKGCYNPPKGMEVQWIPHAGWLGTHGSLDSIGRNLELWNLFHNYHGQIDRAFAEMIWRFAGPPLPYQEIDQATAEFEKTRGYHWNAHVAETGNAMVGLLIPDNGNNGLYRVSQGSIARVTSPSYPGAVLVRIAPTYTFYDLKLESTIARVTKAVQQRAQFDLYNASQELRKLTYADVKYAPLDQLLNQAATEWQKGEYFQGFAPGGNSNEQVNALAKAARAYTRCQALARQVHQSIIPPPARPEDLGLKPWLGAWGDWATRPARPSVEPLP